MRVAIIAVLAVVLLAGCDRRGSVVALKSGLPPVPANQVQIYTEMPAGAVPVAIVEAQTTGGWTYQGWTDSAVANLKALAGKAGGNGVVMQRMGQSPSGAIITGGIGGQPLMALPTGGHPVIQGTAVLIPPSR